MKAISVKEIVNIVGGKLLFPNENCDKDSINSIILDHVEVDSRRLRKGSLFVAINGENTDGHKYVPNALASADAVFIEKDLNYISEASGVDVLPPNKAYIYVDSTIQALQDLGAYFRKQYDKPVIAVTGSVGKTTTREMITWAISSNLKVYTTKGNRNSQIGVPLTLVDILDEPSDISVLELGISEDGGMDKLTSMVKPDIAVVTIIGVAHIEFLKTKENIRDEKLKICSRMDEDGILFLNGDDKLLSEMKGKTGVNTFYYGINSKSHFRAEDIHPEDGFYTYDYCHKDKKIKVRLSVFGEHNVLNSLVSMAISDYLDLDLEKAAKSFETFKGLRQTIHENSKGVIVIDDSYNASPDSMRVAIQLLDNFTDDSHEIKRKIAVLGDMFELGTESRMYHEEVGGYVASSAIDELILLGDESEYIGSVASKNTGIVIKHFTSNEYASEYLDENLSAGDVVLIKASNGMKLSEIANHLKNQ